MYGNKNRSKQQQITCVFVSLFQFQIGRIVPICTPKVPFKSWRGCPSPLLPFSPSSLHPPPCRNTQSNVWNSLFIAELNSNAEKQQAEHADIETLSTHQTHNKTHRHTVTHTDTEYPLTYVDIAATPLCKPLRAPHSGRSAATKAFVAHRQFDCNCKIFAWPCSKEAFGPPE